MKDQSPILEKETEKEKWDRGRSLFLESLYKQIMNCVDVHIIRNVLMNLCKFVKM